MTETAFEIERLKMELRAEKQDHGAVVAGLQGEVKRLWDDAVLREKEIERLQIEREELCAAKVERDELLAANGELALDLMTAQAESGYDVAAAQFKSEIERLRAALKIACEQVDGNEHGRTEALRIIDGVTGGEHD